MATIQLMGRTDQGKGPDRQALQAYYDRILAAGRSGRAGIQPALQDCGAGIQTTKASQDQATASGEEVATAGKMPAPQDEVPTLHGITWDGVQSCQEQIARTPAKPQAYGQPSAHEPAIEQALPETWVQRLRAQLCDEWHGRLVSEFEWAEQRTQVDKIMALPRLNRPIVKRPFTFRREQYVNRRGQAIEELTCEATYSGRRKNWEQELKRVPPRPECGAKSDRLVHGYACGISFLPIRWATRLL